MTNFNLYVLNKKSVILTLYSLFNIVTFVSPHCCEIRYFSHSLFLHIKQTHYIIGYQKKESTQKESSCLFLLYDV